MKYVFSDEPSHRLWTALREVFPMLRILALDPVHLPLVYEYATWRKRTTGSRLLRVIMGKFSKFHDGTPEAAWGASFIGTGERPLDPEERIARERILSGLMPKRRSTHIIKTIDGTAPFWSRVEFIEALAALSAMHPEDMCRKVTGANKSLRRLLWSAAAPGRIDWFLNNQRIRHGIAPQRLTLLPTGTTSNESLHFELNNVFRQTRMLHQSTLALKLRIFSARKQVSHNSALYHATTKQIPSSLNLAAVLATPMWTDDTWNAWCEELPREERVSKAALPLSVARAAEARKVSEWLRKKPASASRTPLRKRTVFTLKRRDRLIRGGVKKTVLKEAHSRVADVVKRPAACTWSAAYKRPAAFLRHAMHKRPAAA